MTNEPKQEVAVWSPAEFNGSDLLPLNLMHPRNNRGRENIKAGDLVVPVLKLLNGMSDEVTEQSVPGAVPGQFLHSGAQEVFAAPIRVIVVAHTRSRAMFTDNKNPRYAGLEKCISRDSVTGDRYGSCDACPHTRWGEGTREPPLCSESHNFTVLTSYGPAIIRMARRSTKSAEQFLTQWNWSPKDLWEHPVMFSTKAHQDVVDGSGKKATNYSLEMKWLQQETVPPAAQEFAESFYEQISAAHEHGKFKGDDEQGDIPF